MSKAPDRDRSGAFCLVPPAGFEPATPALGDHPGVPLVSGEACPSPANGVRSALGVRQRSLMLPSKTAVTPLLPTTSGLPRKRSPIRTWGVPNAPSLTRGGVVVTCRRLSSSAALGRPTDGPGWGSENLRAAGGPDGVARVADALPTRCDEKRGAGERMPRPAACMRRPGMMPPREEFGVCYGKPRRREQQQ